jgi:hypothetical protein
MEPKLKALELVNKFEKILKLDYENYYKYDFGHCRKCALIAVDELISISLPSSEFGGVITNNTTEYWQEVKNEIEKL